MPPTTSDPSSARRLPEIQRLLQGSVGLHQPVSVVPRGIVIPIQAPGSQRFAHRIGGEYPVLMPNNTMKLRNPSTAGTTTIEVKKTLSDIPIGSILSLYRLERHFVSDVNSIDGVITLSDELLAEHEAGTPVYLHAVPLVVDSGGEAGSTELSVTSTYRIVLGDVLEVLTEESIPGSAVQYSVVSVTLTSDIDAGAPYTYTIGISGELHRDASIVYLRAYPAFISDLATLPTQKHVLGENIGPFLWDVMQNRLHDGIEPPEVFLSVETISAAFTELSPMQIVAPNSMHWSTAIPTSAFGFFDLHAGKLDTYSGARKYIMGVSNDNQEFLISKEMRPRVVGPAAWRARFKALDGDVQIRIGFHLAEQPSTPPSGGSGYSYDSRLQMYYLDVTVPPGYVTEVRVVPPAQEFDRLDVGAYFTAPEHRLVLRDWTCEGGRSSWVRYTMLAHADGDYTWGSSVLLVKPVFLTNDALRFLGRLDSGAVRV